MDKISVNMEGKEYNVDKGITVKEFIDTNVGDKEHKFFLAMIDNKLVELGIKLKRDCNLRLIERETVMGYDTYRRSITLLMVKAFADVLGTKKDYAVSVMYSVGTGYYCELINKLDENKTVPADAKLIENVKKRMQERISS